MKKVTNRTPGVTITKYNGYGLNTIVKIMKNNNLDYNCDLYEVTSIVEKTVIKSKRILQEIETTDEIIKLLNHIEESDLLKKGVRKDG